jgi:flagella basal body P-ring formation protein FlgA
MRRFAISLLGLMLSWHRAAALAPTGVDCAPSAEAAVARVLGEAARDGSAEGFKVVAVRVDATRQQSWAMVASCTDVSRPMVAIALGKRVVASSRLLRQGVRIGDRVTVVREGDDSRMELAGWAQDSGGEQDLVRVKMPSLSEDAGPAPVIRCRVVGKDIVEVLR